MTFKTNAKCSGCVARIKEALSVATPGVNWDLDISTPDRILSSEATSEDIATTAEKAVRAAGFFIERIN